MATQAEIDALGKCVEAVAELTIEERQTVSRCFQMATFSDDAFIRVKQGYSDNVWIADGTEE